MTAEIVVMNKMAVALAADSAVTIGGSKVYHSANKVFSASKHAPIGVMVYGAAEFIGIPWETIVKQFRSSIGSKRFGTLKEYGDAFVDYILKYLPADKWQEELTAKALALEAFKEIVTEIFRRASEYVESGKEIRPADTEKFVADVIGERYTRWSEIPYLNEKDKKIDDLIRKTFSKALNASISEAFDKLPVSLKEKEQLEQIAVWSVGKSRGKLSGVVFAGFGEDQIFPSIQEYELHGRFAGWLKHKIGRDSQISGEQNSYIGYFAQGEMVAAFMEGIDPNLKQLIRGYLQRVMRDLPRRLIEQLGVNVGDAEIKKLDSAGEKALEEITNQLSKVTREQYVNPVLEAVGSLPKDELAAMAEALVNLTSFKRRVTLETETVGGPIDVLVISKGDGLVWIKRKHYFRPELNQHFFANYYQEGEK